MNKYLYLLYIFLVATSCSQEPVYPKPKGYLRINFPDKEYYKIQDSCFFNTIVYLVDIVLKY